VILSFSLPLLANSNMSGLWVGSIKRDASGRVCSSDNMTNLAIFFEYNDLYIKISGKCTGEPWTKVFSVINTDLYQGNQKVGTFSENKISIERPPGDFGGVAFKLEINLKNETIFYYESVEGSSHDYILAGSFTRQN